MRVICLNYISFSVVFSTVIYEGPTNTSTVAGNNVMLKCAIQSQTDGQLVFWKRVSSVIQWL